MGVLDRLPKVRICDGAGIDIHGDAIGPSPLFLPLPPRLLTVSVSSQAQASSKTNPRGWSGAWRKMLDGATFVECLSLTLSKLATDTFGGIVLMQPGGQPEGTTPDSSMAWYTDEPREAVRDAIAAARLEFPGLQFVCWSGNTPTPNIGRVSDPDFKPLDGAQILPVARCIAKAFEDGFDYLALDAANHTKENAQSLLAAILAANRPGVICEAFMGDPLFWRHTSQWLTVRPNQSAGGTKEETENRPTVDELTATSLSAMRMLRLGGQEEIGAALSGVCVNMNQSGGVFGVDQYERLVEWATANRASLSMTWGTARQLGFVQS